MSDTSISDLSQHVSYYCISITKMSDTSISDLSQHVSDCTVCVKYTIVILHKYF